MTAIWHNTGVKWEVLKAAGFPDEAALHTLVQEAPHLLPLSGSPRLVVLGREVRLGTGYADLIAIEPSSRLAIIEVKLGRNAEARRAVVAQVLTYAAHLHRLDREVLERDVLGSHLRKLGQDSLAAAVQAKDEEGTFDADEFNEKLAECLEEGRFRLVLVLDEAPPELVKLVGYLESAANLVIDLVTVAAYDVKGSRVLVPQRIDPEHTSVEAARPAYKNGNKGTYADGADSFAATIEKSPEEQRPMLRKLFDWAVTLEQKGVAELTTYHGKTRSLLLVHIPGEEAGFVTVWNEHGAALQVWRTVFQRLAPDAIASIEKLLGDDRLGQGNNVKNITDELLAALANVYEKAASTAAA